MKHIAKTMSRFLLLSLTLGCGFFALSQNNHCWTANYAEGESDSTPKRTYTEADFADEFEADYEELDVSLTQSTTTETSQSLNFAFNSKTIVLYAPAKSDFYINITDSSFTGDMTNPAAEGFDNYDEATGLPVFEGELIFITGATVARDGGQVTIPSTITREGTFIVNIKSIASHCLTGDGSQFNGKNSWYNTNDNSLKFKKVYIPSTIESIAPHAFTDVPEDALVCYEGSEIPSEFADDWMDRPANIAVNQYGKDTDRNRSVGEQDSSFVDEHGRPVNFCLGVKPDGAKYVGNEYDRPLVIEFNVVKRANHGELVRKVFEELPITNTNSPYDSVGRISALSYSRLYGYKLAADEVIDVKSIVFHNIMKFGTGVNIDTSKRYYAKPSKYSDTLDLSDVVSFKASDNATFAGYSIFSLTMDKNLSITSEKYPEPHSLYLDVKSDFYELNKGKIDQGLTEIRYSLYNLYLSSYRFVYEGRGGQLKDVTIPAVTPISYQTLDSDINNKVSIILKNSDVADDFSADKVRTFEIVNLTIQMDLLTTSDSGSKSMLAKSQASYKFAYVTVVDSDKPISAFNYNIFLIIFFVAYIVIFAAAAFGLYKYMKEKFKNDEFRRVNDKKFLKSAILYGLGFLVIAYAIIFIVMRASGFANTIVAFNPTDPLLIAFAIAGMIIGGYFIVLAVKAIKTEKERRKAIRLRLNEDVEDDGTN